MERQNQLSRIEIRGGGAEYDRLWSLSLGMWKLRNVGGEDRKM